MQKFMQATHLKKFDMLRGLASIAVLVPHVAATFLYRILGPDHPIALAGGTIARHAVLVFFLLSGFLITLSILTNVRRNGELDVGEYLAARIARIYPPLVGAIAIVLLASAVIHGFSLPGAEHYGAPGDLYSVRDRFSVRIEDVLRALILENGMLEANGPLWSLYIEFHLYIAALLVAVTVMAGSWTKRSLAALVATIVIGWWIKKDPQFFFYLAVWALGAGLSLWHMEAERPKIKRVFKILALVGLTGHLVLLAFAPRLLAIDKPSVWASSGLQFTACIAYSYVIFLSSWGAKPARFLVRSGDISYSLYVIHFPILLLILSLTQTWMGDSLWRACTVSVVSTGTVIAVSTCFSAFFEDQRRFKPYIRAVLDFALRTIKQTAAT